MAAWGVPWRGCGGLISAFVCLPARPRGKTFPGAGVGDAETPLAGALGSSEQLWNGICGIQGPAESFPGAFREERVCA